MTDIKPKLSELLIQLKAEYLIGFPLKIEKLKELTAREDWNQLYEEYHKLKGNGKTYGFPDISIVAEKLEFLAQHEKGQNKALYLDAIALLEQMHKSYSENKAFPLDQDAFARSLLALKIK